MHDARSAYLETQVLTAPPQKLRLMLIEGCMRFLRQAREAHPATNWEQYSNGLDQARDIVTELISGIRPGNASLNETTRAIYAFVFKAISEAQLLRDLQKIEDALRVLEEERQTWAAVCEKTIEVVSSDAGSTFRQQEIVAGASESFTSTTSFSLDA